ncbi:HAD-IA family hydrolase [Albibacillus kandeliae]|uniref:HAD-IA family hydrolase n=1 Tax=Albibacillus kandeliae TaxID=2174228 RepID=UPI000D692A5F|nr:HAD-IA family hydrolase [Albibacillus kandeliae]
MDAPLKLVVFDVDGTLVDSQGLIVDVMGAAFEANGLAAPARETVLPLVGLSLERIMRDLASDHPATVHDGLVAGYREAYGQRMTGDAAAASAPLFPGTVAMLDRLSADPNVLLGIATGKSRRGLDSMLDGHGLRQRFVTIQVADDHPSKPNPSMLFAALAETGCDAQNTVMVGDTLFDMEMAGNAGVAAVGVSWGYQEAALLEPRARRVIDRWDGLEDALATIWKANA